MNEKFKEYTEKGFEFEIYRTDTLGYIVHVFIGTGYSVQEIYAGSSIDEAFLACDLYLMEDGE